MSDDDFVRQYIHTSRIKADRLHQLDFHRVLTLYHQTPDRRKAITRSHWQMVQAFKENPFTLLPEAIPSLPNRLPPAEMPTSIEASSRF